MFQVWVFVTNVKEEKKERKKREVKGKEKRQICFSCHFYYVSISCINYIYEFKSRKRKNKVRKRERQSCQML